ncbi:Imm49 family immunity protein [Corallococcus macrosporus]|uniref:Uncharacterized protein n=1 Tax=Corallococcus macrosporus DSM 14697 TaxID=1189310 RepID=A0A250K362_9BACT|nr:Imm49 family immunity protein [Corallococcus macrosporus]ATB50041.1 hypothetical protein MYMAC_005696 [Corallococcus macrosporus DSM 14697]
MALTRLKEDLILYLGALAESASQQPDVDSKGRVYLDLARHHRAYAICLLLEDADIDGFFHGLIQSALTWRYFLERGGAANASYRRASLNDAFLDAVAAAQWPLARGLASLSAQTWTQGEEYADDFAYARFLHLLIALPQPEPAALERLLAQFEGALEGGTDARLDVAKALFVRDSEAFERAFRELLDAHAARMKRIADPWRDSALARDYTFKPNRYVLVEGLALLHIAESLGLKVAPEYRFCPDLARRRDYAPFEPLGFPGVTLAQG